jgi:hypothetical protein
MSPSRTLCLSIGVLVVAFPVISLGYWIIPPWSSVDDWESGFFFSYVIPILAFYPEWKLLKRISVSKIEYKKIAFFFAAELLAFAVLFIAGLTIWLLRPIIQIGLVDSSHGGSVFFLFMMLLGVPLIMASHKSLTSD